MRGSGPRDSGSNPLRAIIFQNEKGDFMSDNKPKLFSTFELQEKTQNYLSDKFEYEQWVKEGTIPYEKLKNKVKDIDVLLCFALDNIDKELIESSKSLKIISTRTAGYDHIDIDTAYDNNIKVTKVSEPISEGVAETTLGLMLALGRGIHQGNNYMEKETWEVNEVWKNPWKIRTLKGKKAGIIGMGAIGKRIAELLDTVDMEILYYNRSRKEDIEENYEAKYLELEKIAPQADFLISALPLTEETHHTFDEKMFKKMKEYSTFINISRGGVTDTKALIKALKEEWIKNAAIDVYEEEPLPEDSELYEIDKNKLLLTPHMAGLSIETGKNAGLKAAKNAYKALEGKNIENLVR